MEDTLLRTRRAWDTGPHLPLSQSKAGINQLGQVSDAAENPRAHGTTPIAGNSEPSALTVIRAKTEESARTQYGDPASGLSAEGPA